MPREDEDAAVTLPEERTREQMRREMHRRVLRALRELGRGEEPDSSDSRYVTACIYHSSKDLKSNPSTATGSEPYQLVCSYQEPVLAVFHPLLTQQLRRTPTDESETGHQRDVP
jgi:hypothetical protein